jgi:hypothetical protein
VTFKAFRPLVSKVLISDNETLQEKGKNPIDIAKEFIHDGKDPDGFREEWEY